MEYPPKQWHDFFFQIAPNEGSSLPLVQMPFWLRCLKWANQVKMWKKNRKFYEFFKTSQ